MTLSLKEITSQTTCKTNLPMTHHGTNTLAPQEMKMAKIVWPIIIYHPERRVLLQHGPWDEVPGIFLPTRVLDLGYWQTILHVMSWCVVLLGWITVQEAREYYRKIKKLIVRWRERWKTHGLYISHRDCEALCQTLKLPATPDLTKHQLDFWGKGWKPSMHD